MDRALDSWSTSPYVLQRFAKPRSVDFEYFDFDRREPIRFAGRARLSPYYFVLGEGDAARATLGGVLATVCPAAGPSGCSARMRIAAPSVSMKSVSSGSAPGNGASGVAVPAKPVTIGWPGA